MLHIWLNTSHAVVTVDLYISVVFLGSFHWRQTRALWLFFPSLGVVAAGFLVKENCGIFLVVLTVDRLKGGKNLPKGCVRCVLYIYDLR